MEEFITIEKTGRNYDFIATVENKHGETIEIVCNDDLLEPFTISGGDWVGILADDEGRILLEALESGLFDVYVVE